MSGEEEEEGRKEGRKEGREGRKEGRKEGREDVMTSKNLTALTWQVGNKYITAFHKNLA